MSGRWRIALALVLLCAGAAAFFLFPLKDWLGALVERAQALGPAGAFLFMALFVPACVLVLPGSPITFFCGYAYGFWPTWPAAILMSNLGAAAAFLVSRHLLRGSVERWLARHAKLAAVHRAIGEQSLRLVFLLRLTPALPFNGLNYALGVAPIRFVPYALGTALGMLPGTTINTYTAATLGELGKSMEDDVALGAWGWSFLVLRLLAMVAATWMVTRAARGALAGAWREGSTPDRRAG